MFVTVSCSAPQHATPFESQSRRAGSTGPWGWGRGEAIWPLRPDGFPSEIKVFDAWTEHCAMARVGEGQAYYPAGTLVGGGGGRGLHWGRAGGEAIQPGTAWTVPGWWVTRSGVGASASPTA
jgi:hypothetical protein